ncbi:hypothetical protein [Nocardia macrotermitis]|uniref:Uncharacterized protein n=1 Tax=Nocardia macrotermitis TaxID=2585198 RepID=A0A7K0CW06_9NOCA|nr:hypothetical protein [Nocardia macrotermitis]MQY17700.1 hypothetical protein [Nocardia macrotermitis]
MGEDSIFITSVSDRIYRRTADYARRMTTHEISESELLDWLKRYAATVRKILSENIVQLPSSQSGNLLFEDMYATASRSTPDESAAVTLGKRLAALVAAEAEFGGPLRLSELQTVHLVEVYEELGALFVGLPLLAVLAYQRANMTHRITEDIDGQDRTGLALARARTRAARGWARVIGVFSDALCGYGYRPFRLLGWVIVQLVVFVGVGLLVVDGKVGETVYMSMTSFLNPAGLGDVVPQGGGAEVLFGVEPWFGTISMSVFFALLVRKWFRM